MRNLLAKLKQNEAASPNSRRRASSLFVCVVFICAMAAPVAMAQHKCEHDAHRPATLPPQAESAATPKPTALPTVAEREFVIQGRKFQIPDVWLVNQDGGKVRLYEDLIKDKTVAISFIYTRCTYICPMNGNLFSKIQTELGERLGKDVFLISISMDPQIDTPQQLKTWGESFGRKQGWTLITGQVNDIGRVLKAFTGDAPGPTENHSTFFYIANDKTGIWDFMFGHMTSREVVEKIDELAVRRVDK